MGERTYRKEKCVRLNRSKGSVNLPPSPGMAQGEGIELRDDANKQFDWMHFIYYDANGPYQRALFRPICVVDNTSPALDYFSISVEVWFCITRSNGSCCSSIDELAH